MQTNVTGSSERDGAPGDGAVADSADSGYLTAGALADRVGIPEPVVDVLHRQGLITALETPDGVETPDEPRFSNADADAIAAGVALLDAGVPLDELLDVARRWDEQARRLADDAVELFLRFVRDPIHGSAASAQEASERLATAFQEMLPATGRIVAHHFRGLLLASAARRIRSDGDADELATLARVIPSTEPGHDDSAPADDADDADDAGREPISDIRPPPS